MAVFFNKARVSGGSVTTFGANGVVDWHSADQGECQKRVALIDRPNVTTHPRERETPSHVVFFQTGAVCLLAMVGLAFTPVSWAGAAQVWAACGVVFCAMCGYSELEVNAKRDAEEAMWLRLNAQDVAEREASK